MEFRRDKEVCHSDAALNWKFAEFGALSVEVLWYFYFAVTLLGCDLGQVSSVKKILNLNRTVLVT